MGRVALMTVVATLVWTPIGVWIAAKPKVARIAQPFAQIAASFPVNMTFPFVVGFFVGDFPADERFDQQDLIDGVSIGVVGQLLGG